MVDTIANYFSVRRRQVNRSLKIKFFFGIRPAEIEHCNELFIQQHCENLTQAIFFNNSYSKFTDLYQCFIWNEQFAQLSTAPST